MNKHSAFYCFVAFVCFALILLLVFMATAQAAEQWQVQQEKAHEIAEIARSMGLQEDDPIIVRASELWWEAEPKAYITDPVPEPITEGGSCYGKACD